MRRIFAIASKEIRQLRRDRLTFGMIVGLPLLQMILFGYAINFDVRGLSAAVVDDARTSLSRALVADMEATVGLPAMAQIRSAGLHFVYSANAGKTLIDKFPKHAVAHDFDHLADRLLSVHAGVAARDRSRDSGNLIRNLFGRRPVEA